jgi:hypothetical protein
METKFAKYRDQKVKKQQKSKEFEPLADDILQINTEGEYKKAQGPVEIVQITGLVKDEEEIAKIEETLSVDTQLNLSNVKRGDILWLTALLKRPGSSYNPQTLGVVKVRVVDYFYGLSKLNQVMKTN